MQAATPARRRNSVATRIAILASARLAFVRAGYDGVGVREIAGGAGVTAMMVNRYFGSKEQLFAEVVAHIMGAPGILTDEIVKRSPDLTTFGRDVTAALLARTAPNAAPLDGFLVMLRSASNTRAAAIWREQIERHYQKKLSALLPGDAAPARAALLLSLIAGVQLMRQIIGLSALAAADPVSLAELLQRVLQLLVGAEDGASGS